MTRRRLLQFQPQFQLQHRFRLNISFSFNIQSFQLQFQYNFNLSISERQPQRVLTSVSAPSVSARVGSLLGYFCLSSHRSELSVHVASPCFRHGSAHTHLAFATAQLTVTLLSPRLSSQSPCFRHGSALTRIRQTWLHNSTLSLLSFSA